MTILTSCKKYFVAAADLDTSIKYIEIDPETNQKRTSEHADMCIYVCHLSLCYMLSNFHLLLNLVKFDKGY